MAIWGQFLQMQMVQSTNTAMIRSFASYNSSNRRLSIFLINKDTTARRTTVSLQQYASGATGRNGVCAARVPMIRLPYGARCKTSHPAAFTVNLDPVSITAHPDAQWRPERTDVQAGLARYLLIACDLSGKRASIFLDFIEPTVYSKEVLIIGAVLTRLVEYSTELLTDARQDQ